MGQPPQPLQRSPIWSLIQAITGASSGGVATPVYVVADTDETLWQFEAPNELGFARRDVPSEAELITSVSSALESQPAVVIPPWDRQPGEAMGRYEAVALSCTARPKPHGLTMVFPAFSLVSSRGEGFRRRLFESWEPTTVAYIAGGLTGVHPSFRTAVVSVLPRTSESRLLRMFETPPDWLNGEDDVVADVRRLLRMDGGNTEFGYVQRQQPDAGVRLGFRDFDPRIARRRDGLREYGDAATLGAVFHISRARLLPTDRS